ncbi:Hypothetical protein KVN_LOCUS465 [uncultured virus]|nr:Hypothetical protein KVN_LOCUS465 [uncultured virus]
MINSNLIIPIRDSKKNKIIKWLNQKIVTNMNQNLNKNILLDIYHFYRYYTENDQDVKSSCTYYINLIDVNKNSDDKLLEKDIFLNFMENNIEKYQKNLIIKNNFNELYKKFPQEKYILIDPSTRRYYANILFKKIIDYVDTNNCYYKILDEYNNNLFCKLVDASFKDTFYEFCFDKTS